MTDEGSDGVEPLRGAWVTPNLFNFMGIAPLLGRTAGPAAASQMRRPSSSFGTARRLSNFAADSAVMAVDPLCTTL